MCDGRLLVLDLTWRHIIVGGHAQIDSILFWYIQSASKDSGYGLFFYRIYEEYHKSLWVLDVWLLLIPYSFAGILQNSHSECI